MQKAFGLRLDYRLTWVLISFDEITYIFQLLLPTATNNLGFFQSLSSIFHNPYGFGSSATRSHQTEESCEDGLAVGQRLDRRWLCQGDRKHGFELISFKSLVL